MSETVKTKGIILKISDTPSRDKLLKILTCDGVISAFMTFKKSAGKKSYIADVFTYGELVLFKTDSGNYLVNSVTPEEYFFDLRADIARIAAAGYFSSLIINSASAPDMDYRMLLRLLLETLSHMVNGVDINRVKPVFELKLSQLIGVEPCLIADKKSSDYFFDMEDGRLYVERTRNSIEIKRSTVLAVYAILKQPPETAFSCECDEQEVLYRLAENYIMYHTERSFGALEFLKGVI